MGLGFRLSAAVGVHCLAILWLVSLAILDRYWLVFDFWWVSCCLVLVLWVGFWVWCAGGLCRGVWVFRVAGSVWVWSCGGFWVYLILEFLAGVVI